jgi:hypothetical protein
MSWLYNGVVKTIVKDGFVGNGLEGDECRLFETSFRIVDYLAEIRISTSLVQVQRVSYTKLLSESNL